MRGRVRVNPPGLSVCMEVRQVRADDDGRFVAAPQRLENGLDLARGTDTNDNRNQSEIVEHRLQKRQAHL